MLRFELKDKELKATWLSNKKTNQTIPEGYRLAKMDELESYNKKYISLIDDKITVKDMVLFINIKGE